MVLGVSEIRTVSTYTIKVWFDRADTPFPGFLAAPIKTGPGWYRGDLHMHTAHSDGTCPSHRGVTAPCPVFKTLEAARARGLDFIAVTDHNTTSKNESLRELAPYFDDLLVIPGREMATFDGHANVFGPRNGVQGPLAAFLGRLMKGREGEAVSWPSARRRGPYHAIPSRLASNHVRLRLLHRVRTMLRS